MNLAYIFLVVELWSLISTFFDEKIKTQILSWEFWFSGQQSKYTFPDRKIRYSRIWGTNVGTFYKNGVNTCKDQLDPSPDR